MDLGNDDVVMTVATDDSDLYQTEITRAEHNLSCNRFDELAAAEAYGRWLLGAAVDHTVELGRLDRERIFNLGYYTWVEQQGIPLTDFDARRDQGYWDNLMKLVDIWDKMIQAFNST